MPFLGVLWVGVHYFGLIGAAWAWTFRVFVDAILLILMAGQGRVWFKLFPGLGLVFLSLICSPDKLYVSRILLAGPLILAAIGWGWPSAPIIRHVLTLKLHRFVVRSA